MASKFYAVKKGKTTGVFRSWDECKNQVDGFSGAQYKSFKTEAEALEYLGDTVDINEEKIDLSETGNTYDAEIYVDGSYNDLTHEFSYGMVVLENGKELKFAKKFSDNELAQMHNVAGEIKGAEAAMRYAIENSLCNIAIYHDYEGIAKWCLGEWKANRTGTKDYKLYYDSIKEKVTIRFIKVVGHSNNKYNDIADELAKQVLGIGKEKSNETIISKGLYIVRDIVKLEELLDETAKSIWTTVCGRGIETVGNQKRYTFEVDGSEAYLDIYQRGDGQTTLRPVGNNTEYSVKLKEKVEMRGYKATSEQKAFSIFIGEEWTKKTVDFLTELCGGNVEKYEEAGQKRVVFISDIGDKLTLTIYANHRMMVQGKPLYLYNEFLSFVSYSPKMEMNDIIQVTNEFVDTNTDINETRKQLAEMMPTAYAGNVNDVIWKLFSPSISLKDINKDIEDYSCFAFPALRALEGYLKCLLDEKGIVMDKKHNFGNVFSKDHNGGTESIVISKMANKINDRDFVEALEDIYNYFKKNRHVLFHVDQILINTKVIEDRQEAITIINDVARIIEETYKKIRK